MLSRDKALDKMNIEELVSWLGKLCKLWYEERANLSTGLLEIESEMARTMDELRPFIKRQGEKYDNRPI